MSLTLFSSSLRRRAGAGLLALLLVWSLALPAARAQRKVQVLTRTIEQTLPCPPGTLVRIRAEKATVRVQGWDKASVQVVLRLSARHPERAVAEQELPAVRYKLEKHGSSIELENYFARPAGTPAIRSDLRAEYTVLMPAAAALQLENTYGQTTLLDLTGKLRLAQNFGQIVLQNLSGTLTATARYADLTGTNLNLTFDCEADKSAVRLTAAAGRYTIRNRYGSVLLEPTSELQSAFIDAERTEVTISVPQLGLFNYHLTTAQGALLVPPSLAAANPGKGASRHALILTQQPRLPLIRVVTSYAPLTLRAQPLLIKR
ncbi:hypothetical protein SAMN02745146_1844 [Hymenobacter daecheongensis DSM 21074]|uniref:Adhesin domain-containing protein n=1 Tax=Hymenobacter daecheongensis DSM 21074 TaxID=1121955 RepID=A0A1M6EWJ7_9BACT|nr:hypothetical protein [Hymenobacter daecheongensis]SHI89825.1 hypothetical protein SAMN02745146_1844 [Hymenobacter daecheongensis DSM 21074]